MEEVSNDNVVGRLYNIIYKLKDLKHGSSENALSKVFSVDLNNKGEIMPSYAELFKMCIAGIKEVEKYNPKNIKRYKNTLNSVIEGLSKIYFTGNSNSIPGRGMEEFDKYFDDTLMVSLVYCSDFLSEYSNAAIVENEKIHELIKEIEELNNEILEAKLNNDLEKVLVCQLNQVRESLLKFELYGAEGIMDNISASLGSLILNREKVRDEKEKSAVEKVFSVIGKINGIFSVKNNISELVDTILPRIEE